MSLHDENGIAPDAGITGPADADSIDIDRDTQLDDGFSDEDDEDDEDEDDETAPLGMDPADIIAADPASDTDADTGRLR
ncbi:MAG: hypothetical protein ACTHKX_04685 [Pseudolysinimonas sp.]